MSRKFDEFMEGLDELCRHHDCEIALNISDEIEIRDLANRADPVNLGPVKDCTQDD